MPIRLDASLHQQLVALSRSTGASLFMVLQAGLSALLTRLGAGTDIALGSPIAGRGDAALDELVGFFVNTLVLRTDTAGNPAFTELIGRVRGRNLAAYAHQDVPFERLVEVLNPQRSLARHPLFQVMLAFETEDGAASALQLPNLTARPQPVATTSAKFDLSVALVEHRGAKGEAAGIDGVLEYAADLFDRSTVEVIGQRLVRLLGAAVADASRPIGSLCDPGRRRARHDPGGLERHRRSRSPPTTLPALFAAQAARTPDATAVVFEDRTLSYAALDAHANRLAQHLQSLGVGPETVVGLCVERSPEMVVGLLGILKAGGAYLPLDPNYPRERLAFMLADAGAPVLITQQALLDKLPELATADRHVVRLDADWPLIARKPATAPVTTLDPRHPAYVIYTSGSTRHAKGRRGGACEISPNSARCGSAIERFADLLASAAVSNSHRRASTPQFRRSRRRCVTGATLIVSRARTRVSGHRSPIWETCRSQIVTACRRYLPVVQLIGPFRNTAAAILWSSPAKRLATATENEIVARWSNGRRMINAVRSDRERRSMPRP